MIPALLSPDTVPTLLGANLIALICIGISLERISLRLHASACIQREVLRMLVIAHADTCKDGPVEQEQIEGEANRRVA